MEAIVGAPGRQNQPEVRSVLGSAQFCAKFYPHFSTITSPSCDLTSDGKPWKCGTKEDEAFDQIKKLLTNASSSDVIPPMMERLALQDMRLPLVFVPF